MELHIIDWLIVLAYAVFSIAVGFYFKGQAEHDVESFFLAGRKLTWWVAGTSIAATTFAVDTPLAVSGFVRSGGIYENWFWWSYLMGGMMCVFFYARLWRRAKVVTDIEFIELRYTGKAAAVLRGFSAVYGGILANCVVMGWVMLAMAKITLVIMGWPEVWHVTMLGADWAIPSKPVILGVQIAVVLGYTIMSGFWGVVVTDLVQYVLAVISSVSLAGIVVWNLGGPKGLVEKVSSAPGVSPAVFNFVPDFEHAGSLAVMTFVVYISVQWLANGQGGSFLAQRLFATRNEKHAMGAGLWFNFLNYIVNPWPWVLVGLASLAVLTTTEVSDPELAYPMMMVEFLPVGLRGLMIAAMIAAFMSTIDTRLNWGASYLINDIYARFMVRGAKPSHYVMASKIAVLILVTLAAITAWQMDSVGGAWKYFVKITAGVGILWLIRWFWWRVNAWSEISALVTSFILANTVSLIPGLEGEEYFPVHLILIVFGTTLIWLVVTILTPPEPEAHLEAFYRRVRPGGWWGSITARCPDVPTQPAWRGWIGWIAGVACIYTGMFGVGYICLGRYLLGASLVGVGLLFGIWMWKASTSLMADGFEGEKV